MDQIFYNGKIITMEHNNAEKELVCMPEAVLVRDDLIYKVGSLDKIEKIAEKNATWHNLDGRCLMPSFIDAHSHIVMTGQMAMLADLSDCCSFADVVDVLADYAESNHCTKEHVVIGYGYDHNFLKEGTHPDKFVLDKVSSEIPILIIHISAHLACANSAALALAGIDFDTPDPDGGLIGRIGMSNEPSGYIEESGLQLLQSVLLPRVKTDFLQLQQKMQDIYIKNGITTVQDGASTENDINILRGLNSKGKLKIDVVAYPVMDSNNVDLVKKYKTSNGDYTGRLRIGGYKIVLDGSPQGRTAWMSKPYVNGEPEYCGYPWMKNELVDNLVKKAVSARKQILAHCNGDAASEQFISAYEKAVDKISNKEDLRPVMIHCQTVRNDQLERMSRLKMIASMFVGHVWYWGDIHMRNFGPERGKHISPVRDAIDKGVVVSFHQDTPVTKPDMLHSVWCAVNRISRSGKIIGEEQSVVVYDALKAITINAAYQYFEEKTKGSIKEGKIADLVILSHSPLEIDQKEIRNIKVLETIKEGETIYKRVC
jgi:hypothetical protein